VVGFFPGSDAAGVWRSGLHLLSRVRTSGAIALLPPTRLHDMERGNFTYHKVQWQS